MPTCRRACRIGSLRSGGVNVAAAAKLGIRDCEVVAVRLDTEGRDLQFGDVMDRVSPQFRLELHLDTDEANAAGVKPGDYAELVPPLLCGAAMGLSFEH